MTFGRLVITIAAVLFIVAGATAPGWTLGGVLCLSGFVALLWGVMWDALKP